MLRACAALASFSVRDRVVSVYNAGAKGVPTWGQDAPAKEDLAKFLAGVADVLGVEAPGEATDGNTGGENRIEDAMVLIRLLLSDEPEKMPRGEQALSEASEEARFVNRYARYDLREDYAESFRLMGYFAETFADLAPEKFLYLNALGWNARLDGEQPGPLWYSGDDFQQLVPKKARKALFERLMGKFRGRGKGGIHGAYREAVGSQGGRFSEGSGE